MLNTEPHPLGQSKKKNEKPNIKNLAHHQLNYLKLIILTEQIDVS